MRTKYPRAMVILACAVLVTAIGAYPASAASLGISFPSSLFDFSRVQNAHPASQSTTNFFSVLSTSAPAGGLGVTQKAIGFLGLNNDLDLHTLQLPSHSSDSSWMSGIVSGGVSVNGDNNPARDSYDKLITRFGNQSNIFVY